jgi:hypothetical protein
MIGAGRSSNWILWRAYWLTRFLLQQFSREIDHRREEGDNRGGNRGGKKGWGQNARKRSTKRSELVDGKRRQFQIPNEWTLMSGCSQPEVCCRECTLAVTGLDTHSGNKRLQAANQTGVSKKVTHFWEVVPQWIPVATPETRYTKPN